MALLASDVSLPSDFQTNFLMLLRWIHFIAGITWVGLLYFFNLVNIPFMKELDAGTKGKVMPGLFLHLNSHGWESNRLLSIGIGGGIGWMMMLSVWGIIWRIQKRLIAWTKANAENGTPIPEQSARMARMAFLASWTNFYLSFPLLFFMGAASHYPMFGQ